MKWGWAPAPVALDRLPTHRIFSEQPYAALCAPVYLTGRANLWAGRGGGLHRRKCVGKFCRRGPEATVSPACVKKSRGCADVGCSHRWGRRSRREDIRRQGSGCRRVRAWGNGSDGDLNRSVFKRVVVYRRVGSRGGPEIVGVHAIPGMLVLTPSPTKMTDGYGVVFE